jgi:hypothetical protein
MSFLKSLFGLGKEQAPAAPKVAKEIEHRGFTIKAMPYLDNGQYQTAGVITKEIDGVVKEHRFVRADRFSTLEDAADIAVAKGRQIIDERGDGLFA